MNTISAIRSELIKLKYPPILWLSGFVCFLTLVIIFTAHYIDINNAITLGRNPWHKLNRGAQAIFSIFIAIPFIALIISSAIFLEYKNNGFKQLYTLPKNRIHILLYKLAAILLTIIATMFILSFGVILIGYILNLIYPETEFSYFSLPLAKLILSFVYIFISCLGIIGIQFFLSLKFKSFLVSASFGILAFVVGLILSTSNNVIARFFPYCYPIMCRDANVFDSSQLDIREFGFLNEIEIYSIIVFVIFILLSLFLERKKNI